MITSDGSTTIHIPEWNEQYHSKYGAIQEAYHVFIKNGLDKFDELSKILILEIGFGTGLNCLITFLEAKKRNLSIKYTGIEAYPINKKELKALNYSSELKLDKNATIFKELHEFSWEKRHQVSTYFSLLKKKQFFEDINSTDSYNLIYYDAFGARVQPELWTVLMFEKMYRALCKNGILVTYSAKGSVRRAMQEVGFVVERLEGPPGKREMLRGLKK